MNITVFRFLPRAPIGMFLRTGAMLGRTWFVPFGVTCGPASKCRSKAKLRSIFTLGNSEIPNLLTFFENPRRTEKKIKEKKYDIKINERISKWMNV